jgi:hypothetical protein
VVPGDGVNPGFKEFDPVFRQFGDDFYEDLLDAVAGFFFVVKVFHTNPEEQERISLEQGTQPVVVMVFIVTAQQLLVGHMVKWVFSHDVYEMRRC